MARATLAGAGPEANPAGATRRAPAPAPGPAPAAVAADVVPAGWFGWLLARIKNILIQPRSEWLVIAGEAATVGSTLGRYVIPLQIVASLAGMIGMMLLGSMITGSLGIGGAVGMGFGAVGAVVSGVVGLVVAVLGLLLFAWIVNLLAPTFGGERSMASAVKVVAYAWTPAFVAGLLMLFPPLAILMFIAGLYGLYLLYLGLPPVMRCPPEKALGYTVVVIVCAIVLGVVLSVLFAGLMGLFAFVGLGALGAAAGGTAIGAAGSSGGIPGLPGAGGVLASAVGGSQSVAACKVMPKAEFEAFVGARAVNVDQRSGDCEIAFEGGTILTVGVRRFASATAASEDLQGMQVGGQILGELGPKVMGALLSQGKDVSAADRAQAEEAFRKMGKEMSGAPVAGLGDEARGFSSTKGLDNLIPGMASMLTDEVLLVRRGKTVVQFHLIGSKLARERVNALVDRLASAS